MPYKNTTLYILVVSYDNTGVIHAITIKIRRLVYDLFLIKRRMVIHQQKKDLDYMQHIVRLRFMHTRREMIKDKNHRFALTIKYF